MAFTIVQGGGMNNFVTATGGGNTDTITFNLLGGRYAWCANATWGGGNLALAILMPDGSTYINCATSLTADGCEVLDLCAGKYKLTSTTATAVQTSLCPVPLRPCA